MTGQTIVDFMYLMAIPVQGDLKRVQTFSENGYLYMRCVGIYRIEVYQTLLGKRNMQTINEHCVWDEAFTGWRTPISMREDIEREMVNKRKYNKKEKTITPYEGPELNS